MKPWKALFAPRFLLNSTPRNGARSSCYPMLLMRKTTSEPAKKSRSRALIPTPFLIFARLNSRNSLFDQADREQCLHG